MSTDSKAGLSLPSDKFCHPINIEPHDRVITDVNQNFGYREIELCSRTKTDLPLSPFNFRATLIDNTDASDDVIDFFAKIRFFDVAFFTKTAILERLQNETIKRFVERKSLQNMHLRLFNGAGK